MPRRRALIFAGFMWRSFGGGRAGPGLQRITCRQNGYVACTMGPMNAKPAPTPTPAPARDSADASFGSERDQISQNIEAVLEFYTREEQKISRSQRTLERVSGFIGRPVFLGK